MLETGTTHLGVATDHIIESFRNDLWAGYKTGAGIDPVLFAQFPVLEDALRALGVAVWAEIELEADDALASAVAVASKDRRVTRVVICTPDKDLAQCVRDPVVVQLDRRAGKQFDEAAGRGKSGVPPASIPDWLALVGDSADGYPGLPGWGARSAAAVLAHYGTIERIPDSPGEWAVPVRNRPALAATLRQLRPQAMLFKDLATLRVDRTLLDDPGTLRWTGPTPLFAEVCARIDAGSLATQADRVAGQR